MISSRTLSAIRLLTLVAIWVVTLHTAAEAQELTPGGGPSAPATMQYVPGRFVVFHRQTPVVGAYAEAVRATTRSTRAGRKLAIRRAVQNAVAQIETEQSLFSEGLDQLGIPAAEHIATQTQVGSNITVLEDLSSENVSSLRAAGYKLEPVAVFQKSLANSIGLTNAIFAWNEQDANGDRVTGKNVRVGILDTGIDIRHPAFGACSPEQFQSGGCATVPGGRNFLTGQDPLNVLDSDGHGTHVASIVGANGGSLRGMAPDAKLYALKVCDQRACYGDAIFRAFEYALDPNGDGNPDDHLDVINMSFGGLGGPDDAYSEAVDRLSLAGVVSVASAGNIGQGAQMPGSPAAARTAIAVGSVENLPLDQPKTLSEFSLAGPTVFHDGERLILKPDVVAPGGRICAASSSPAPTYAQPCGTGLVSLSGTSMSSPHVAGIAALIKQRHPEFTAEQVKAAILQASTLLPLLDTHRSLGLEKQGHGFVDAREAVKIDRPIVTRLYNETILTGQDADILGDIDAESMNYYSVEIRKEGEAFWQIVAAESNRSQVGHLATIHPFQMATGTYEVRLTVIGNGQTTRYGLIRVSNTLITSPTDALNGSFVNPRTIPFNGSQPIEVRGFASGFDLVDYNVEVCNRWGLECTKEPVALVSEGRAAVANGVLATIDPGRFPVKRSGVYQIKLVAHHLRSGYETSSVNVDIDFSLVRRNILAPLQSNPSPLRIADLDHDGTDELITQNLASADVDVQNLTGSRNGFPARLSGFTLWNESTAIGDINGDGFLDLTSTYINGPTSPPVVVRDRFGRILSNSRLPSGMGNCPTGSCPSYRFFDANRRPFTLVDLDGDGVRDLLFGNLEASRIDGSRPFGYGSATDPAGWNQPYKLVFNPFNGVSAGDLDGDGSAEVVVTTLDPARALLVFGAGGQLLWSRGIPFLHKPSIPVLVDLNRDGRLDILFTTDGSTITAYDSLGNVLAGFPYSSAHPLQTDYIHDYHYAPALADFDLDGIPEIVTWDYYGIEIRHADGEPMSNITTCICDTFGRYCSDNPPIIANLDRDPEPEILTSSSSQVEQSGAPHLMAFNADSSPVEDLQKAIDQDFTAFGLAAGDLDGDGKNEIVARTWKSLFVWKLNACAADGPDEWAQYERTTDGTHVYRPVVRKSCQLDSPLPPELRPQPTPTATPTPIASPTPTTQPTPEPPTPQPTVSPVPSPTPVAPTGPGAGSGRIEFASLNLTPPVLPSAGGTTTVTVELSGDSAVLNDLVVEVRGLKGKKWIPLALTPIYADDSSIRFQAELKAPKNKSRKIKLYPLRVHLTRQRLSSMQRLQTYDGGALVVQGKPKK